MESDFGEMLQKYADLIVQVGLNLQPGQRLLMFDSLINYGVPIETAPLVRAVAASAYRAGARFVDVIWADPELQRIRFQEAPGDSFAEFPSGISEGFVDSMQAGDALLTVLASDPTLLEGQPPERIERFQKTAMQQLDEGREFITRNEINWTAIGAAIPGWAARVFPDTPPEAQVQRLWQAIFATCRLDQPDPVAAWKAHIASLAARAGYLNRKQYRALHYQGPGTDLTIGLPAGHIWESARMHSQTGIDFTANLPTEEIFTLPHRQQAEGVVHATRPLPYGGTLIEDFSLRFEGGRVVQATAHRGEQVLRDMLATDEGSARLGEVALVPHSSPISQSGVLFYNILFDENAACHLALGRAYPSTLQGGADLSPQDFAAAGGNHSLVHLDFMIGSGELDVDGLMADGTAEPVMRSGEWAFDV